MRLAAYAEWTKLRTLASNYWLIAAAITITIGAGAAVTATTHESRGVIQDTTRLALSGIDLGQGVIAVLAVLAITEEYGNGTIQLSLLATPRRNSMLGAKAVIISLTTLVTGAVIVAGSLVVARRILPRNGYTPARGYPLLALDGATTRAAIGSVLYLTLVALLSLGIATVIRSTAASVGTVLGLIYLPALIAQSIGNSTWQRHLEQLAPTLAGLAIQATTDVHQIPLSPWAGLGVLAAWAISALLAGGVLLRLRDA